MLPASGPDDWIVYVRCSESGGHPPVSLSLARMFNALPWSLRDMDNQTNFAQGTLEDELQ